MPGFPIEDCSHIGALKKTYIFLVLGRSQNSFRKLILDNRLGMMMNLKQKLKLDFDPTKIEPLQITDENHNEIVEKLKLFDDKLYSMGDSVWESVWESVWDSTWDSLWESMEDSMWFSTRASMRTSIRELMRDTIGDSIWFPMYDPMWDSMRDSMWDSIWDSMRDSLWTSTWGSMFASIMIKLSKEEYEGLFKYKAIGEELSFEKMRELCELYNWFSRRGLFPHRDIVKYGYLLGSWKNPEFVQKVNIR